MVHQLRQLLLPNLLHNLLFLLLFLLMIFVVLLVFHIFRTLIECNDDLSFFPYTNDRTSNLYLLIYISKDIYM